MFKKNPKIGIVGSGSWGTALTFPLTDNNHKVLIWSLEKETAKEINKQHTNNVYLPNVSLSSNLKATNDIDDLKKCDYLIFSVPTQFLRTVLKEIKFSLKDKIVINVAKGIEKKTLFRISEIFEDTKYLDADQYVMLTGPSHAEEVAQKMPTTVVAASSNHQASVDTQKLFGTPYFRVYSTDDVIGSEVGSALKNVIALAAGIIDGLGLGDNTKAALITRGLADLGRLGMVLGSNPQTFSGLSGIGDIFVTCSSKHSRNRYVGEKIGQGMTLEQIIADMKMVAEGIPTTESAYFLSQKHDVEMPITEQVYKILFLGKKPLDAVRDLMTRQSKHEWWW